MSSASDTRSAKDLPRWAFVALACALPIALFAIHQDLGHHGDLGFFHDWYLAFRASPAFYRDGPGLNYPIVGVLLVCGPAVLVERVVGAPLDVSRFVLVLKSTLVLGEIALVFTAAWLARVLGSARPRWLAIALYLVPSTWAGGAWYGQTDVFGTVFLLASAAGLILYRREGRPSWLAIGLGALALAVLAKQLTFFAVPGLAVLAVLAMRAQQSSKTTIPIALFTLLLLFVADPFLDLPNGYRSHLWFVVAGGGSSHGQLAVASGASVWSLFVRGGTPANEVEFLGISSMIWGWVLWLAAMAIAARHLARGACDRSLVAMAGIGQLAMATLLTGVHERYLTHAIPLLILADGTRGARPVLGWITGLVAGLFVLASIHEDALPTLLGRPEPLACIALAWLAAWLAWPAEDRQRSRE